MAGVDKVKALLRGAGFSLSTRASRKPSWFAGYVGQISDLETGTPLFRGILAFADTPSRNDVVPALRAARGCAAEILRAERDRRAYVPEPEGQPSGGEGVGSSADETPEVAPGTRPGGDGSRRGPGAPRAGELVGEFWGEGPIVAVLVCGAPLSKKNKADLTKLGLNYVDSSGAARILHKAEGATLFCVREAVAREDAAGASSGPKETPRARPPAGPGALPKREERVVRALLTCSAWSGSSTLRVREPGGGVGRPLLLGDLGDLSRVSLDTVQRTLGRLEADGLVTWRRRRSIKIRKHAALLGALEASYLSRVAREPAPLHVECVDTSRLRRALAMVGLGTGSLSLRAAATGRPAYSPVMDIAVHGTAEGASLSEDGPLRILLDVPRHELPAAARVLRAEPMSAAERLELPESFCGAVHLHAAYDESLLCGGGVAQGGVPVVSPLQLYLDAKAYPRDFGADAEHVARNLRAETFPVYYGY